MSKVFRFCVIGVFLLVLSCSQNKKPEVVHSGVNVMEGVASWYGPGFHGRRMANGKIYDMHKLTAAHRSLPFGTKVEVLNLDNGQTTVLTITDRGPFIKGRIIDVSRQAAKVLGFLKAGHTRVRVRVL